MSDLTREAEAARTLILNLKDVIADDEGMALDMIEAETGLLEAIDGALQRISDVGSLCEAIDEQMKRLKARKSRLEAQDERIRASLCMALGAAGLKKAERPLATLSLRSVPPKVIITNEADLPSQFLVEKTTITPDKKAIADALKDGAKVAGAELSNGGEAVSVRFA